MFCDVGVVLSNRNDRRSFSDGIIIMKKSLLLLIVFSFSFCALWAQTKISGIVTDAGNGAPIGYATVAVKGTAVGVTTDAKGAYTIPIP